MQLHREKQQKSLQPMVRIDAVLTSSSQLSYLKGVSNRDVDPIRYAYGYQTTMNQDWSPNTCLVSRHHVGCNLLSEHLCTDRYIHRHPMRHTQDTDVLSIALVLGTGTHAGCLRIQAQYLS